MIAITGATGSLGRLVISDLLAAGVAAKELIAIVRTPSKATDLTDQGVSVRQADYDDRAALDAALSGVQKLLLISGTDVGSRVAQHQNVIAAAVSAGAQQLAYTSILKADISAAALALDHKATEEAILASGLNFTLLRNGFYYEATFGNVADTVARGVLVGASADGRISFATRADYAAAAAAVLIGPGHDKRIYELGGDRPLTMTELTAVISQTSGKPVVYQDVDAAAYASAMTSAGLPAAVVDMLTDVQLANSRGELETDSEDLSRLIGRPTTTATRYFKTALAS